ncbi:Hypothetical predicted protein, partial [Lynx pardinus]
TTARLTCTLSSGYNVGGYHIYWYQQKQGTSPWYLLRFYSDSNKHQGPGVPSHFSRSKDASANAGLLLISGPQPEDEADYYCAIWHASYSTSFTLRKTNKPTNKQATQKPTTMPTFCLVVKV